jgi:metallophosphoesterase (TIGR00282 family)
VRILCLGDVVGTPGRDLLAAKLPAYKEEQRIDFCVVNGENVVDGSGVNRASFKVLREAGADVLTTGDHVYKRADILKLFQSDPDRILRPHNYPVGAAGRGVAVHDGVAVISLQGRVFMDPSDDPFRGIDMALRDLDAPVVIVDFHAEATSEKRAMAWHIDGKVSVLFGTHTHVPTADEEIMPKGTAYVTDLGMCGGYRGVIGRRAEPVLRRMRTKMYAPFEIATEDVRASGIIVDVDELTGKARSIERITFE